MIDSTQVVTKGHQGTNGSGNGASDGQHAHAHMEAELTLPVQAKLKVVVNDLLVNIALEIGNLTAAEAIDAIPNLLAGADENYFRLGGVLSEIQMKKYYEGAGYETFRAFVETEFDLKYRKAMYWIQIYDCLVTSGIPWSTVRDIGWTKLKDLAPMLTTFNADEWVATARHSTVLQLQEAIAVSKAISAPGPKSIEAELKAQVTTVTFKVHVDQKPLIRDAIAKARKECNTDLDGTALEAICMNYLAAGNVTVLKTN